MLLAPQIFLVAADLPLTLAVANMLMDKLMASAMMLATMAGSDLVCPVWQRTREAEPDPQRERCSKYQYPRHWPLLVNALDPPWGNPKSKIKRDSEKYTLK